MVVDLTPMSEIVQLINRGSTLLVNAISDSNSEIEISILNTRMTSIYSEWEKYRNNDNPIYIQNVRNRKL